MTLDLVLAHPRGAEPELRPLLERVGALYLDTGESRGLVPDDVPDLQPLAAWDDAEGRWRHG